MHAKEKQQAGQQQCTNRGILWLIGEVGICSTHGGMLGPAISMTHLWTPYAEQI
jgi:hypothetical protein